MRMPLLDRGTRDSTVLPTMKCAQCNQDVHIRLIGQHQCAQQPAVPDLPADFRGAGLGSFFDTSEEDLRSTGPGRYGGGRKGAAVESRAFPSTYKPSLQMLDEDVVSANTDEDFDFDSMLHKASTLRQGSVESDGIVSPGPRRIPELTSSSSTMSMDSLANLSPLDFARIAGRTSPTANGFSLQHESASQSCSPAGNSARLEQAREELRSGVSSPATGRSGPLVTSPQSMGGSNHRRVPQANADQGRRPQNKNASASAAALQSSLMQQMASGAVPVPESRPQAYSELPQAYSEPDRADSGRSPPDSGMESVLTLSSASPLSGNGGGAAGTSPPPLMRSAHREASDNGRHPGNNERAVHTRSASSHQRPAAAHQPPPAAAQSPPVSPGISGSEGSLSATSRSPTASSPSRSENGSLSIGTMMRSRTESGSESAPRSPVDGRFRGDSNRSNSGSRPREIQSLPQNHQQNEPASSSPPISVDTQICISARKPSSGSMSATPQSAQSLGIGHGRKVTRNPTAPPVMNHRSAGRSAKSPFDELASLVPATGQGPPPVPAARPPIPAVRPTVSASRPPVPAARPPIPSFPQGRPPVPHIDTQGPKRVPTPSGAKGGGPGRSLKSAKLDSLLDDLMGEMQALSAEVRTESDRESMGSTASAGASAAASPGDLAREHAYRARLDSTVSTASTSSTLSANGSRVQCVQCRASVSRSALVAASNLTRPHDVPAGMQGVEFQGRVYCVRDYRRQTTPVCRGCNQLCESQASRDTVHTLDAYWHRRCFNCQECRQPFPDKSFYVLDGLPYCRYDYHKLNHSLCGACQDPIEGPCAQVHEGRFHPDCFACTSCGELLCDVYYSLDGKFFCERHVHQTKQKSVSKRRTLFGRI